MPDDCFIAIVGPMFSGKSTRLLQEVNRRIRQGKRCAVFKPKIDNRYSDSQIVSHDGDALSAVAIETGDDVIEYIVGNTVDVVAVDEAFMIPGVSAALAAAYLSGHEVIAASIDISYAGKILPEISKIVTWATSVVKCTSVCEVCKKDARFTHKKNVNQVENEIVIGGEDLYEPRCRQHFPWASHLGLNLDVLREQHIKKEL